MADALSQDQQQGKLTTPLGENALALARFSAIEGLSELFEFRIEAVSTEAASTSPPRSAWARPIELMTQDGQKRYFHGVMTEARWAGTQEDLYLYQLVLRPWLWLLTRTSDCKIFAQMTPIDIIKQVFSDRGFSDFRDATTGSPPTLEYCVQYRETDFNFVCRLMEEYGVYYFFEHSNDKHTLVLADGKSSHQPAPGLSSVPYNPADDAGRREMQYLETWSLGRARAERASYTLEDYGYKKPSANLLAQAQNLGGYAHDSMEMFDYTYFYVDTEGNDLVDQGVGENLAKYKLEALQSLDKRRSSMGAAAVALSRRACHARAPSRERRERGISRYALRRTISQTQTYRSGGRSWARLRRQLRVHAERPPVPRPARHPQARDRRLPVGPRRHGRRDRRRQGRADSRAVLLGPQEEAVAQGSRRADSGRERPRGALFTPRVGDEVLDRLRGRRPRPADCHRLGLQRHQHRADDACRTRR